MDKYEYQLKLEQLKNLVAVKDYETAAEIANTINWRKVRNSKTLLMVADVYEALGQYEACKEVLLQAYDHSSIGRGIVSRLAEVAIKAKNVTEAEEFYSEFLEIAPKDNRRYVIAYKISCLKDAPLTDRIAILEELKEREYTEMWAYELAALYGQAGMREKCVETCDELILWFGEGEYVEKALDLKRSFQPLTPAQEKKYQRFRSKKGMVEISVPKKVEAKISEESGLPEITVTASKFNTQNLQEEIAKGMKQIMDATEKETVTDTMDNIKKIVGDIPYLQGDSEEEEPVYDPEKIDKEVDEELQSDFKELLGEEQDGQMSLQIPEDTIKKQQKAGQLSIEEVLEEWEKTKRAVEAAIAAAEQKRLDMVKEQALAEANEIMERLKALFPMLTAKPGEDIPEKMDTVASRLMSTEEATTGDVQVSKEAEASEDAQAPKEAEAIADTQISKEAEVSENAQASKEAATGAGQESGEETTIGDGQGTIEETVTGNDQVSEAATEEETVTEDGQEIELSEQPLPDGDMSVAKVSEEKEFEDRNTDMLTGQSDEVEAAKERKEVPEILDIEDDNVNQKQGLDIDDGLGISSELQATLNGGRKPENNADEMSIELKPHMDDAEKMKNADASDFDTVLPGTSDGQTDTQAGAFDADDISALEESSQETKDETEASDGEKSDDVDIALAEDVPETTEADIMTFATKNMPDLSEYEKTVRSDEETEAPAKFEEPQDDARLQAILASATRSMLENADVEVPVSGGMAETDLADAVRRNVQETEAEDMQVPSDADQIGEPLVGTGDELPPDRMDDAEDENELSSDGMDDAADKNEVSSDGLDDATDENELLSDGLDDVADENDVPSDRIGDAKDENEQSSDSFEEAGTSALWGDGTYDTAASYSEDFYGNDGQEVPQDEGYADARFSYENGVGMSKGEGAVDEAFLQDSETDDDFWGDSVTEEEPQEEEPMEDGILTAEEREMFSYFLPVPGMEEQILAVLENVPRDIGRSITSLRGNLIIQGEEGSGKTVLATSLIKVIQRIAGKEDTKIGKISAKALNRKNFAALVPKMQGGFLIVDKAGDLTAQTAARMSHVMEQNTQGMVVILEDDSAGIKHALSLDFSFAKKFTGKVKIPVFTIDELVDFGKSYATEMECVIEEMGVLALYNRINNIKKLDRATTLAEVKDIVDHAIESAESGGLKKLFTKKYDENDYLILREKDFE